MTPDLAERLRAAGFETVETRTHYLVTRGDCVALVERIDGGPGSIGSTGMLSAGGLAYLVWQEGRAMLAAKGSLIPATPEQAEAVQLFSRDLKSILA